MDEKPQSHPNGLRRRARSATVGSATRVLDADTLSGFRVATGDARLPRVYVGYECHAPTCCEKGSTAGDRPDPSQVVRDRSFSYMTWHSAESVYRSGERTWRSPSA